MIVVDVNVLVAASVQDELSRTGSISAMLGGADEWAAPSLWRSEYCNVLAGYIRLRDWSLVDARSAYEVANRLVDFEPASIPIDDILHLIGQSSCTAYDLEFVALAHSLDASLVTFDRQLLREFPGTAIHPVDFAA